MRLKTSTNDLDLPIYKILKKIVLLPRDDEGRSVRTFLVDFAKENNLEYYADGLNNVVIYKKSLESSPPIVLQTHTDDLYPRPARLGIFNKNVPLVAKNGKLLKFKGATYSFESASQMALVLDLLANPNVRGNIEALFTSNCYNNALGVNGFDTKKLSGKSLIALRASGDECKIETESAGFARFKINFKPERYFISSNKNTKTYKLSISGLEGGSVGERQGRNNVSSHKLLVQLLQKFNDVKLNGFEGKESVFKVPNCSECIFTTEGAEKDIKNTIIYFHSQIKKDFKNIRIKSSRQLNKTLIVKNGQDFLNFISGFKQGVIARGEDESVVASENLCYANLDKGELEVGAWYNDEKYAKQITSNLKSLCEKYNMELKLDSSQVSFKTPENSQLLSHLKKENALKVDKTHGFSEAGILQQKIKKLDVVGLNLLLRNPSKLDEGVDIKSFLTLKSVLEGLFNVKS